MDGSRLAFIALSIFFAGWGATFLLGSRRIAERLARRARDNRGIPTFVSRPMYLQLVGWVSIGFAAATATLLLTM